MLAESDRLSSCYGHKSTFCSEKRKRRNGLTLIFGFDIGTTSIGWAVINRGTGDEDGCIAGLGVRIFPEARDPKGVPLNQTRRMKRLARRQTRRRRDRRRALNVALAEAGLLPPFGTGAWPKAMTDDPWLLRKRAVPDGWPDANPW